uniref:BAHD acyltransferase n=1 Tax=Turnera subulata TaxID=218843 RepID=A0A516IJI8_9ROSI
MEIEITLKETIKPSSPTPPDKRILKLSLSDQFTPVTYTSLVFFYPAASGDQDDHHYVTVAERTQQLKKSLSEALTHFYPLAGRLKDNVSIECEDQGAEYIEARIKCLLSDFLVKPDAVLLKNLLPAAIESTEAATGSQLLVQANMGGTALKSKDVVIPAFMGDCIFPQMDLSFLKPTSLELIQRECVMKSEKVPEPTRVEAVSALIWKCAISASRSSLGLERKSLWSLSVNMRKRLTPQLPENSAGNCVGSILSRVEEDADGVELGDLVGLIRKGNQEFGENYAKKIQGEGAQLVMIGFAREFGEMAMSNDIDFYLCTSWCRFELYEAADFGWGKPTWLSFASTAIKNAVVLIDTKDGAGIEAWLTLSKEDMALFESNQELLEFAAVNPRVSLS